MNRSIRKLVGSGIAAVALGGFFALIVAPALAGAPSGTERMSANAGVANVVTKLRTEQTESAERKIGATVHHTVTATSACSSAKANLATALTADKAEDETERTTAPSAADADEDNAELAARKPLVDAVRAACGFTKPTLSAQCTAALQALKTRFQADVAEDASERAAGTEGSAGDLAEDQAEKAAAAPLWQAVRTACAFGTHTLDFSKLGSTSTWSFQR